VHRPPQSPSELTAQAGNLCCMECPLHAPVLPEALNHAGSPTAGPRGPRGGARSPAAGALDDGALADADGRPRHLHQRASPAAGALDDGALADADGRGGHLHQLVLIRRLTRGRCAS